MDRDNDNVKRKQALIENIHNKVIEINSNNIL